jgi:glycosyltransferase involved in cell wall biosynthesis
MADKSKRILVFTTAYRPFVGGSEIALEQIIRSLPDTFFDIVTPRLDPNLDKIELGANYCIYRLGFGGKFSKILFPIFGFFKARRIVRRHNISIIHAYQASYGAGAAYLFKIFKPSAKFILTLQEGKDLEKQSWIVNFVRRLIIQKADAVTAISEYLKKYVYSVNPAVTIEVIPNGVDFNLFNSAKKNEILLESLGIKGDERVIISVSRLVKKNGLGDLIEAVSYLRHELPRVRLIIIGEGPLMVELKKITQKLKIENFVIFLGRIGYEKLPSYLKLADVFVRPSWSEGLGNAFLEAMAAGIPVIGTPVGGIVDFMIDGQTGIFCKPHDSKSIADAVLKILSDKRLNEKLIQEGRFLIADKYDWNVIAKKFKDFYHRYGV